MGSSYYTTLNEAGQIKIPVELICQFRDKGNSFTLTYDAENKAIVLIPYLDDSTEADNPCQMQMTEMGTAPGTWNYICEFVFQDIMAYLVLPKNVCSYMLWDENTVLVVSRHEKAITVKTSDLSPEDIALKRSRGSYTSFKPTKERFVEVYCKNAVSVWNSDAKPKDEVSEEIERIIADTLITVSRDNRTSIRVEYIGRSSYIAKITNTQERISCLIKSADSYEEQAAAIYDTLEYTSII